MASQFENPPIVWQTGTSNSADPRYTNGVQVMYSPWDFHVYFVRATPTLKQIDGAQTIETGEQVVDRVVMSPQHAKAFLEVLRDNVQKYESQHGEIPVVSIDEAEQSSGEAS